VKVFVWGAGRVGRSFARALSGVEGIEVVGAWNRTFRRALESSQLIDTDVCAGDALPDTFQKADVVLLAVVDDAVVDTAKLLARHLGRRQTLLHTSGSLPSSVMDVEGMRATLGGCHPLQALADPNGDPEKLRGSTFAVEGEGVEAARAIALAVGGKPLEIATEGKVAYHAAAVLSANYLTVLVDAACDLLESAGVPPKTGIDILLPLLQGTLDNLERCNAGDDGRRALAESLTGPVRRGDAGTIRAHRKALRKLPAKDLLPLYELLTARAAEVTGRVDEDAAERVRKALPHKKQG
jgi:predicted short-subunit dehydrogenase-like oxidoreductase (DUF2520 family)